MKLIVSDLDGTLLNKWHTSSPAIDQCVQTIAASSTAEFVVATGRHLFKNHLVGLTFKDLPIYKVAMNGALVRDKDNQPLKAYPLPSNFVEDLIQQFPQVSFELMTEQGVYTTFSRWGHFHNMTQGSRSINRRVKFLVAALRGGFHYQVKLPLQQPILKIDCHISDLNLAHQVNQFIAASGHAINSGPNIHNFEITAQGVTKLKGLFWLMNYLEIDENQVAVYGNDLNDLEMLGAFTHSYVPQNAVAAAKQAAKQILPVDNGIGIAQHMVTQLKNDRPNS